MKKKLINSSIKNIKKFKPDLTDEDLEIIEYGLEGTYLTITKLIIILVLSIILHIFKEVLLTILFYNIIRFSAFGIHASKSSYCLISSLILFIIGPILTIYLHINLILKIVLSIICIICIILYAPADTVKRPLINKKKRTRFKIISIISSLILTSLIIIFNKLVISNIILLGLIEATILILPVTYNLFGLPYNNYKQYSNI